MCAGRRSRPRWTARNWPCRYALCPGLFLQDWRSACIGCDADILEQHATEQEVHVIGEGVELGKSRLGCSGESGLEINRRTAHRLTAERLPVEADMPELVLGQFFSEGRRSPRLSSLRCRDCPGRIAGGGAPRNCERSRARRSDMEEAHVRRWPLHSPGQAHLPRRAGEGTFVDMDCG